MGKTTLARNIADEDGEQPGVYLERTEASFYRMATGVELDLILDLPNSRRWAIEIRRGLATTDRALHTAFEDVKPDRASIVHGREDRFPKGAGIEAMGLTALLSDLASIAD